MPVILRPSSLLEKCFLFGWRRIERMPETSTGLMRLPTTSLVEVAAEGLDFGELRHQVSSSPSGAVQGDASGTSAACSACQASRAAACSACFFDRPSPAPWRSPADVDGGEEALGVVGALVGDLVAGQLVEAAGGQLLEPGLVVLAPGTGRGLGRCARRAGP